MHRPSKWLNFRSLNTLNLYSSQKKSILEKERNVLFSLNKKFWHAFSKIDKMESERIIRFSILPLKRFMFQSLPKTRALFNFNILKIKRLLHDFLWQMKSYVYNEIVKNKPQNHFFMEVTKWTKQKQLQSVQKKAGKYFIKRLKGHVCEANYKRNHYRFMLMLFKKRKIRDEVVEKGLSAHVIKSLGEKGEQYNNIAHVLGVQPPFITRVAKGERNLTIEHLQKLAAHYGKTLPLFLMGVLPSPKEDNKSIDENVRSYLQLCDEAQKYVMGRIHGSLKRHALEHN